MLLGDVSDGNVLPIAIADRQTEDALSLEHPLRMMAKRAVPEMREAAFHARARHVGGVGYRITVATTTLGLLTRDGADRPVWRAVGHGGDRRALAALPKAR